MILQPLPLRHFRHRRRRMLCGFIVAGRLPRSVEPVVQVTVMNLWWRRQRSANNSGIAAGQRFLSADLTRALWEVIAVARYPGDLAPHVRLLRVGSRHEGKTVSLQVLCDRRFYQPAP